MCLVRLTRRSRKLFRCSRRVSKKTQLLFFYIFNETLCVWSGEPEPGLGRIYNIHLLQRQRQQQSQQHKSKKPMAYGLRLSRIALEHFLHGSAHAAIFTESFFFASSFGSFRWNEIAWINTETFRINTHLRHFNFSYFSFCVSKGGQERLAISYEHIITSNL